MPAAKNDPGFVRLAPGFHNMADALNGDFCITTKQLCRALMCSREFVKDHLRAIPHTFVSPHWAAQVNWNLSGGTYWSMKALDELASKAVIERRTHVVGGEELLTAKPASDFNELAREYVTAREPDERKTARDGALDCLFDQAPEDWSLAFKAVEELGAGRSALTWGDYGERGVRFIQLGTVFKTIADLRNYGDSDEEWHRKIWNEGAVRLTISFPDGTERKMYAADPTYTARDKALSVLMPFELLPRDYMAALLARKHEWRALDD